MHKGFALVDIFQDCVSFNKINTHKWYKENTVFIPDTRPQNDKLKALALAFSESPWSLGIIYEIEGVKTFEDSLPVYEDLREPLYKRTRDMNVLKM